MLKNTKAAICLLVNILIFSFLFSSSSEARLSPGLEKNFARFQNSKIDSLVEVVVFLDNARLQNGIAKAAHLPSLTREARIKSVLTRLQTYRSPEAEVVKRFLTARSQKPVKHIRIVPAFSATVPLSTVDSLSQLPGVTLVVEDSPLTYTEPVAVKDAPTLAASVSNELQMLNIPYLWNLGLKGKGRLICSFDTGVDVTHPALGPKWRGNHASLSASWFSTITPDSLPSDKSGHGTHTMGIMVGSTVLDTFGVAPEAEWITAGVIDQGKSLSATISDILLAFEWALNPDGDTSTTDDVPDVILNSWGIPKGLFPPCDETFFAAIDNVEAAGIVTVFAAGNEGPDPVTLRNPADRATTPLNSFAVGAVNDDDSTIAAFSSRGPSSCDSTEIKPEVVAPGVSVRSSYKGGGYAYMTGTSMAAPYVAGLVALLRQYNPNATVTQIKQAIIQSCTDLGAVGEDNAYGNGLPNAATVLQYLPVPPGPLFHIERVVVTDDGVAVPGEEFGLQIMLQNSTGTVENVTGTVISPENDSVVIVDGEANFFFGDGGMTAINAEPFLLRFDSAFYHGEVVPFQLVVQAPAGPVLDTLSFELTVGFPPKGTIASHTTGEIDITVSDFGQYGFAQGSIYNLNGDGFRYQGSQNLLYEAGLVLGRNALQLSSAIRDSLGQVAPSDFTPIESLSAGWTDSDGGFHRDACFHDSQSEIPIPVTVRQHTVSFPSQPDNGVLLITYYLKNDSVERLTGLSFGFFADFDLAGGNESCLYDETLQLIYQRNDAAPMVGVIGLHNISSVQTVNNGAGKIGFRRADLYAFISSSGINVDEVSQGDMAFFVNAGPFTLEPGDSVEVTLALVGGSNEAALYENARAAQQYYRTATGIEEGRALPSDFTLFQNYPNPFNPNTTIRFSLERQAEVTIDIYNALGQKVTTLCSQPFPAGTHTVEWDATNVQGKPVACGMYFYRLTAENQTQTRKMMLLK